MLPYECGRNFYISVAAVCFAVVALLLERSHQPYYVNNNFVFVHTDM